MAATVRLDEIVDALGAQLDERPSFLDRETGEAETVSEDLLRETEESGDDGEPDLLEWQKEEWEIAKLIVSPTASRGFPRSLMYTSGRS